MNYLILEITRGLGQNATLNNISKFVTIKVLYKGAV